MRGKPLYGYAAIAVVGLSLMIVLSFIGVNQKDARLALEGDGEQPQETVDTSDPMALGEQAYKSTCIGCHGGNFDGPVYSLQGLADKLSKEEVMSIIKEGQGTGMPAFPNYDEAELSAIAEYLLETAK
ncbi:MAG: c-type cytochrome [Anaerobacillus sp.]|uniref:c-type cytochrome n=1 Tax=Anaerobacillus sp. TaxID=1872506 RepID=UPI003918FDC4